MTSGNSKPTVDRISAVTLSVNDIPRSLSFYRTLGFEVEFESPDFVTLLAGASRINLALSSGSSGKSGNGNHAGWGRFILYVPDVDAWYRHITGQGIATDTTPRDALWNERYFHVSDPDGHQLSFAAPLSSETGTT